MERITEHSRSDNGPELLAGDMPSWQVTTMDANRTGTRWDFYLAFIQREQEFEGRVEYNPAIFDKKTIVATIQELGWILNKMSCCPTGSMQDLCP